MQIKALKIVLEKHIHWVMNSSIFQDEWKFPEGL